MTLIIGIFQFHCKSEQKQVKWNEIKQNMCKYDSTCSYLQSSKLFKWLLRCISWQGLPQNWMITVPDEKSSS